MALTSKNQPAVPQNLTTSRGAALYIGAILGPGLLLLPGLAAAEAGPASILAWLALLGLSGLFAAVFSALGRHIPSAGGVIGYVTAGLGPRAGRATGWMFLAGVVGGAPIVCLIGASYVTDLTGGGQLARAAVAAALLLTVIGLAAGGLRASAAAQLVLVSLLTGVVVVAVAGSARGARAGNWTPFAPHGWLSVGSAAATLMFSFVGWEAVAPLTTRFANPSRQLPRAVAIALAVTTALYLGLAVATISVLGPRAATDVPLAGLLSHAVGAAGPDVAAVAAIVLTLGATNAYINGAAAMAGQLAHAAPGSRRSAPMHRLLAAIAAAGLLLITRVRAADRQHRRPGRGADGAVPHGLPGRHGRGRAGAPRPGTARLPAGRAGRHRHARILRLGARDTCRGRAGRRLAESAWRPPRAQPGQRRLRALPRQGVLALLGQTHPGRMLRR